MTRSARRLGDRGHLRTLADVALAAAAEHANQQADAMRAQAGQRLLQRIGRMRIVDHDQRLVGRCRRAGSCDPSTGSSIAKRLCTISTEAEAHCTEACGDSEQVGHVESAQQGAIRSAPAPQGVVNRKRSPAACVWMSRAVTAALSCCDAVTDATARSPAGSRPAIVRTYRRVLMMATASPGMANSLCFAAA